MNLRSGQKESLSMREWPFVIAAYSVAWIVFLSYMYYLSRRERRLVESTLKEARERYAK